MHFDINTLWYGTIPTINGCIRLFKFAQEMGIAAGRREGGARAAVFAGGQWRQCSSGGVASGSSRIELVEKNGLEVLKGTLFYKGRGTCCSLLEVVGPSICKLYVYFSMLNEPCPRHCDCLARVDYSMCCSGCSALTWLCVDDMQLGEPDS